MSPRPSASRARPVNAARDQARSEPGHPVRVTLLPRGLRAFLSGLVVAAISLVQGPEEGEPKSLTHVILRGHTDQVNAVAFAPDGRTLASGGEDHIAVLCDVATSREQPRILQHEAPIYMLSRSPSMAGCWPPEGSMRWCGSGTRPRVRSGPS